MEEVDKEISEMKLSLNARARIVAESYLSAVSISAIATVNVSRLSADQRIDLSDSVYHFQACVLPVLQPSIKTLVT